MGLQQNSTNSVANESAQKVSPPSALPSASCFRLGLDFKVSSFEQKETWDSVPFISRRINDVFSKLVIEPSDQGAKGGGKDAG